MTLFRILVPLEGDVVHAHNLATGETTNLGVAAARGFLSDTFEPVVFSGDWLVFDSIRGGGYAHNLATGDGFLVGHFALEPSGDWLVFLVFERDEDDDLNGDGDTEDGIVHMRNLPTGEITNLELAGDLIAFQTCCWFPAQLSGNWLVFRVSERNQGEDLNGDGDTEDGIVHVRNLATGETASLGISVLWSFKLYSPEPVQVQDSSASAASTSSGIRAMSFSSVWDC